MPFPRTDTDLVAQGYEGFEPIADHPGYYVDEFGTVWSRRIKTRCAGSRGGFESRIDLSIRPLKASLDSDGYQMVNLDGKTIHVHKLVLEAFVGPKPEGLQARHGDGNKTNNGLENLCWGTALENAHDRDVHGRTQRGEEHRSAKVTLAQVIEIRRLRKQGVSLKGLSEHYGINTSSVSAIATGRTWKHIPLDPGTLEPYWSTCPAADQFRKPKVS